MAARERFADPFDCDWKEISVSSLTEKRADFFIVEKADDLEDAAVINNIAIESVGRGF